MKKSTLSNLLIIILSFTLIAVPSIAMGNFTNNNKILFNQKELTLRPKMIDGTIMIPLHSIVEEMDANMDWDSKERTIDITYEDVQLSIDLNNQTIIKNGQELVVNSFPTVSMGTTMVSLDFLRKAFGFSTTWNEGTKTAIIESRTLPVIGSYDNLRTLLKQFENSGQREWGKLRSAFTATKNALPMDQSTSTAEGISDYSGTNVQVQGVDEADLVKTDGKYIYQINHNKVNIIQAYPANEMKLVNRIIYDEQSFHPQELYVDDNYLIVIGSTYYHVSYNKEREGEIRSSIYPSPYHLQHTAKAMIYDNRDKSNLKLIREVELEGHYISSRKIGSSLYLIANKHIDYYGILREETEASTPFYRDSAGGAQFKSVDYTDICYFPGSLEPNYLIIGGINLDEPNQEVDVSTYLGSGQNIYASLDHLYVAVTQYETALQNRAIGILPEPRIMPVPPTNRNTIVYRFGLSEGQVTFGTKGEVPGTILNQFSMDEHQGYFRIATTSGDMWRDDEHTSKNNLYVLNQDMDIVGKIEGMAPGERIYSARFMGNRGYMVTFRTVDPLFVLDLTDPLNPTILGDLKIPGYSDYLHPYDENHILGFGKETIEIMQKDGNGRDIGLMAFDQGLKISLFDVTDVENPIEKFKEEIGDRGTHSELLYNHRALLFSKEKNILAFPVTVMEVKGSKLNASGFPEYGQFAFQGAYIYGINLEQGFQLRGKISHLSDEDQLKAGRHWYDSDKNVQRLLYIEDRLYTLSPLMIKAHSLPDLQEINGLKISY